MTFGVFFREAPPHVRPIVHDAVEVLGYFRSDAAGELASIFERIWPKGLSTTALIYSGGEDMTPDERKVAGIGQMRMPREIWAILSDKGRADPRHAVAATTRRVFFNVRRADFLLAEPQWSTFCSQVKFQARALPEYLCALALELNGLVVAREQRFALPLPDCGKEWCPCRWDFVPDG